MIDLLIRQVADVYATATNQATPLHYAVAARREDAVKCLLLANSSLKSGDEQKFTPLHVAILRKYPDLVECIIEYMIQHHEYRKEENTIALGSAAVRPSQSENYYLPPILQQLMGQLAIRSKLNIASNSRYDPSSNKRRLEAGSSID